MALIDICIKKAMETIPLNVVIWRRVKLLLSVHLILGHRWSPLAQWTSSSFDSRSFRARWIGQTVPPFQFLSNLTSKFLIKPWIEVSPKSKLVCINTVSKYPLLALEEVLLLWASSFQNYSYSSDQNMWVRAAFSCVRHSLVRPTQFSRFWKFTRDVRWE